MYRLKNWINSTCLLKSSSEENETDNFCLLLPSKHSGLSQTFILLSDILKSDF